MCDVRCECDGFKDDNDSSEAWRGKMKIRGVAR